MDPVTEPAEAGEKSTEQVEKAAATPQEQTTESASDERGFPENTPVADMAPAQQVAYWKYQSRKHEETAKANLSKANAEIERLKQAQMTDSEKAIAEAKKQGAQEARSAMAKDSVKVFIQARISDKESADLIAESINHQAFLAEDGTVDNKKLGAYLDKVAGTQPHRDPHQGPKQKPGSSSAIEKARAEAARRSKKNSNR